jgi:phenylalanyl-tRNA synthetase beta chain
LGLFKELCPAAEIVPLGWEGTDEVPSPHLRFPFRILEEVAGMPIPSPTAREILTRLQFTVADTEPADVWEVGVPGFRREDIHYPVDLAEEILRIHGVEEIPSHFPSSSAPVSPHDPVWEFQMKATNLLAAHGFRECYTDSLVDSRKNTEFPPSPTVDHPLAQDHDRLRFSLLPGLLEVLKFNENQGNFVPPLFECGHVFGWDPTGTHREWFSVALIVGSSGKKTWLKRKKTDVYRVKAWMISLLDQSGLKENLGLSRPLCHESLWQEGYAAQWGNIDQKGWQARVGNIHLRYLHQIGFKGQTVLAAEGLWDPNRWKEEKTQRFRPFSEFPAIRKDLSLWVDSQIPAEEVRANVEKIARKMTPPPVILQEVDIFDSYILPEENHRQKGVAISLTFRHPQRTLLDSEVALPFTQIQEMIENKHTAYRLRKAPST